MKSIKQGFQKGLGFLLALIAVPIFAYTVSGSIKTWTAGETLTATDLNNTVNSLKTAVENATQLVTIQTPNSVSAGNYHNLFTGGLNLTTEPQIPVGRAGTVKNARVTIVTNTSSTVCTVTLRKNLTDTAIQLSVPANSTTAVTDSDTVSFVATDAFTWRTNCGANAPSSMFAYISFEF